MSLSPDAARCYSTLLEGDAEGLERDVFQHKVCAGDGVLPALELDAEDGDTGLLSCPCRIGQRGNDVEGRLHKVGGGGRADRAIAEQQTQQRTVDVGALRRAVDMDRTGAQGGRITPSYLIESAQIGGDPDGYIAQASNRVA